MSDIGTALEILHRIGISLVTQGLAYAIAATKTAYQVQDLYVEEKSNLATEKMISANAAKQLSDKDAALADLNARVSRAVEVVDLFEGENAELKASLDQAEATKQVDAQYWIQYGLVTGLKADPGAYD